MTEIHSQEESVICHYKDSKLVGITHFNGHPEHFKAEEMSSKDYQEFYETNQSQS